MKKIAVITDTNSGITTDMAKKLGVFLVPMPFIVDDKEYFENESCTYEEFFDMLSEGKNISTSQPAPYSLTSLWDKVLEEYEEIIYIPMSSALSGSYATAKSLAGDYNGRVHVPDNKRISITQMQSVLDAVKLADNGLCGQEICRILEDTAFDCSIYLAVNTLELLKKSGRVTAAGATLATILGLKPVLQIQGEKLDAFAKVRGMANAEATMLNAIKKDCEERFAGRKVAIHLAYSGDLEPAEQWLNTCREFFGDTHIEMYKLPRSICCHVGAGVKGIAVVSSIV